MKFRRLPFEERLDAMAREGQTEEMAQLAAAEFLATVRTTGFQLVTGVLRNLERGVYENLLEPTHRSDRSERLIGALQALASVRRSLVALLPDDQQLNVDWHDDFEEDALLIDPSVPRADEDAE